MDALDAIPLIIADLSDKQMLQYMGRENGDDYKADFMVMLNIWEAGAEFLMADAAHGPQNVEPTAIARRLAPGNAEVSIP